MLRGKPLLVGTVASVLMLASPCGSMCPADIDFDGSVGIADLLSVVTHWGYGSGTSDFTGPDGHADGVVDFFDLWGVLAAWGPCPE